MSQVKISGNASGTGVLTIAAPNTNTDRSITIPDKAGAIAVGAGTVVQFVNATITGQTDVTTTTYTDSGITASITPTSSSNKIIVHIVAYVNCSASTVKAGGGFKIFRDSTEIQGSAIDGTGPYGLYLENVGSGSTKTNFYSYYPILVCDSPATTSSITYKAQMRPYSSANSGRMRINPTPTVSGTSESYITLMEVVA